MASVQRSKPMKSGSCDTVDALGFLNDTLKVAFLHISGFKAKVESLFMPNEHPTTLSLLESQDVASEFLKAVKVASNKEDYDDFLKVIKDYGDKTIDMRCFSARVSVLLKGRADLILEFNNFLPTEYHMRVPPWDQLPWDVLDVVSRTLDFGDLVQFSCVCANWRDFQKNRRRDIDALRFLKRVKVAFRYNMKKYGQFMKVLSDYRANSLDINGVKAKVQSMFEGHVYLILEFNKFLPKKHRITLPPETMVSTANF
ncbi:paired amphipathic helix protein Sin3-like 5 [Vicia villosa]|uniref:paired amphipathic helix protein Sin3-like 5 n=1 Tax=Vicia villosa TaxID=3911 RepID=UPI00273BA5EB|nr:paired amphipathic helix protein Sin3-like 5 [Vicia villosa]